MKSQSNFNEFVDHNLSEITKQENDIKEHKEWLKKQIQNHLRLEIAIRFSERFNECKRE